MSGPDRQFWQNRFETQQTGWDRGAPSPQLLQWLDDGTFAAAAAAPGARPRVVVPGCGSGHEVVALAAAGVDVTGLDYTEAAVARSRAALADAGLVEAGRVELADVLAWQPPAPLDAVYEQTCLCALHPDHWTAYGDALHGWLRPGGRLLLLAMQSPKEGGADGFVEGPPYHVHVHAARALFPASRWDWPKPPYPRVPHPAGMHELAIVLTRR